MIKLAILGTRGIPNNYGGFERFAEVISVELGKKGYQIWVLKPSHKKEKEIPFSPNIQVVTIKIPSLFPANIQTLLYDLFSLMWFAKSKCDIALECGHSFAIWLPFFKRKTNNRIIVNVDGLEHTREKWGLFGKLFLKTTEKIAIKYSKRIICDHPEILDYVIKNYKISPIYIPYGAYPGDNNPGIEILSRFGLKPKLYYLVIARITPENSIELILKAARLFQYSLVIVGDISHKYSKKIHKQFKNQSNLIFLNAIFDQQILNTLRYYCKAYIHGHSVGGTNPSLLEAMACGCKIIAHDNPFNKYVLRDFGVYFSSEDQLVQQLNVINEITLNQNEMLKWILEEYNWEHVATKYHNAFLTLNYAIL